MKGKIDKDGVLHILRAGVWTAQECKSSGGAYRNDFVGTGVFYDPCHHKCPLFGEPTQFLMNPASKRQYYSLALCKRELVFEELTDERAGEQTDNRVCQRCGSTDRNLDASFHCSTCYKDLEERCKRLGAELSQHESRAARRVSRLNTKYRGI